MSYHHTRAGRSTSWRWAMPWAVVGLTLLGVTPAPAQTPPAAPQVKAFTPFKIIGNIYYVGDTEEAVYLITTPAGHILLDTGYAETVPIVRAGVEALGFQMRDIRIMISGHAHADHVAGHALVKEMTGARVLASQADAVVIESGGARGDYRGPRANPWKPAKVDQIIRHGERITLGGVTMTAHLTPGHTRGNTTWTTTVAEGDRTLNVVFMPSVGRNEGVHVVNYPNYPTIAEDYQKTFAVLKTLPCDVFLGPHGRFYDLEDKFARMQSGGENPFIDPAGCRQYVERGEAAFLRQLYDERRARR